MKVDCVYPILGGLRQQVMGEAHSSRYSIHPGSTKMYHDLRCLYWWDDMKKDIAEFVASARIVNKSSLNIKSLVDYYRR